MFLNIHAFKLKTFEMAFAICTFLNLVAFIFKKLNFFVNKHVGSYDSKQTKKE